jgi:hypothetical protein
MQPWIVAQALTPDFLRAVMPTIVNLSFSPAKNTVAVVDTSAPKKRGTDVWCYKDGSKIGVCRAAFRKDLAVLLPGDDEGEVGIVDLPASTGFSFLGRVVWLGIMP